jgi:rod shape-determining protein MreD
MMALCLLFPWRLHCPLLHPEWGDVVAHSDRRPGIRPRPTLGRRLDAVARMSFPASITVLMMLLTEAPLGIQGQAGLLPAITLCSVWFWSLVRPDTMPPPAVFAIGLLMDLLGYLPLGVGVFTMLCVYGIAQASRRMLAGHGFALIWTVFGVLAVVVSVITWLLVMLLSVRLFSPRPALFQAALAVALYPVLAIPFAAAHRSIADPDGA